MRLYKLTNRIFKAIGVLFFLLISIVVSCKKDDTNDENTNPPSSEITISLMGSVVDANGAVISAVALKAGTGSTTSDANGLFILENVKVSDGRYYISAEKSGFFAGGRGGLAKNGERYTVKIVLLNRGSSASVNGASGGTITTGNGGDVVFAANSFVTSGGQAYTGSVKVYQRHLSPDDPDFAQQVPGGDLAYEDANGDLSPLVSFGMTGVELEDNSGNKLQLASGITATVRFPIAASQLATAPVSIPLLSFDEIKGVWKQEGTAIKNGNFYEGTVGHFSWWNVDVIGSSPAPMINGTVVDCNNNPMPGVTVTVDGQFTLITNAQGQYSNWIPAGTHTLQVLAGSNGGLYTSSPVSVNVNTGTFQVPNLTVPCPAYVTVQTVDCNGNNTAAYGRAEWLGYVSNIQFSSTGSFQFSIASGQSITLRLFNGQSSKLYSFTSGGNGSVHIVGTIDLCYQGGGGCPTSVIDIDGNAYNVVQIGNQCWMKENLRTAKYRDGTNITGNLSDSMWVWGATPAQTDFDNNPANSSVYGKLYNWYAVADSRGLCPVGWHVPDYSEWDTLATFLDPASDTLWGGTMSGIAGGMLKSTGDLQTGTGLWEIPNTNASNLSGFMGLPGGFRSTQFLSHGYFGFWWTNQQTGPNYAAFILLSYNGEALEQNVDLKGNGFSVRCIKD